MNSEIKEVYREYKRNWQLLYDLFKNLPEDKLSWAVSPENRTLKQQFAHIVSVEKCYLEVIKTGAKGWKHCHLEDKRAKLSKDELLKLFVESDKELREVLKNKKPNEKIDYTKGDFLTLVEHVKELSSHELFHQGQLVTYIRTLGQQYFPASWSVWGY